MVVSGSSSVSGLHRETTVLSLVMAYRSFGRFRQASTRLDTPPCSGRHHPVSAIAPTKAGGPSEGAFNHPAPGQQDKTFLALVGFRGGGFGCLGGERGGHLV